MTSAPTPPPAPPDLKAVPEKKEVLQLWTELQYRCDYCNRDISNTVRIRCAECMDELDLCLSCFSAGVSIRTKQHRPDHNFRLIDNMQFPLFEPSWSADEELLMFEGLDVDGFGNWADTASNMLTKTPKQIRDHYMRTYCKGPAIAAMPLLTHDREAVWAINRDPSLLDHVAPRDRGPNRKCTRISTPKPSTSKPVRSDMCNYMPLRHEFEIEWDNDAEASVKDLVFTDRRADEDPTERALKVRLLQIYCRRIERRESMRNFVVEHQLHDTRLQRETARRRSREEREIAAVTRRLETVLSAQEYNHFLSQLVAERQLEDRLRALQHAITTAPQPVDSAAQLLGTAEQDFLARLDATPQTYLAHKLLLLRAQLRPGTAHPYGGGGQMSQHVLDYCIGAGWLNQPSVPAAAVNASVGSATATEAESAAKTTTTAGSTPGAKKRRRPSSRAMPPGLATATTAVVGVTQQAQEIV